MKLSDFSVVNYRSITTARKIKTNNMTVLVGKNNEGKSNILRALTLAMDIMKIYSKDPRSLQIAVRPYLKKSLFVGKRLSNIFTRKKSQWMVINRLEF